MSDRLRLLGVDWMGWVLSALGSSLIGYAYWESFQVRLVRYSVSTHRQLSHNELRIAHLSDLHMTRLGQRERKALELVAQFRPTLIALTGDLIPLGRGRAAAEVFLQALCAIAPVFAVEGNSEVVNGVSAYFAERLHQLGGTWLYNEAVPFRENFWVAGTGDPHWHRDNAAQALRGVPKDAFCLLLSHSPDIVADPAARRADLILCGHTHGGQIRVPLLGPLYIRARKIPKRLAWGKHEIAQGKVLITTSGVGTTRLPLRFLCPPEVVGITVQQVTPRSE